MQDPRGLRAVLFDLDGVLVDSRDPIAHAINQALTRLGLPAEPEERLHRLIGPPLHDAFREILADRGGDSGLLAACIAHYRDVYRELSLRETVAMPGIESALEALAARFTLAVATSKPEAFAAPILDRLGLSRRFALVVGPPLVATHTETKTRTVGRALEGLGLLPAAAGEVPPAAMVGDRHMDVTAARRFGLLAIGVRWGIGSPQELRDAGAHHLVSSGEELVELLA